MSSCSTGTRPSGNASSCHSFGDTLAIHGSRVRGNRLRVPDWQAPVLQELSSQKIEGMECDE